MVQLQPEIAQDRDALYPESDGQPMAENTIQYRWIVRLVSNLKRIFRQQTVFVAGDLLWYPVPVETPPAPSQAPDVMVVIGRPDGDRRSYKQWEENNIAPQVVFEILSPGSRVQEMLKKQKFYMEHGVLEFFFYDPESFDFLGMVRQSQEQGFLPISPINFPWTLPTLGIQFAMADDGLMVFDPDGQLFKDPEEVMEELDQVRQDCDQMQQERDRALAKLRELGIDPNQL